MVTSARVRRLAELVNFSLREALCAATEVGFGAFASVLRPTG